MTQLAEAAIDRPTPTPAERGRALAEAFDQGLRQHEALARRRRLEELGALNAAVGDGDDLTAAWEDEDIPRLEEELLEVSKQLEAIRRSRVWRAAQTLRAVFGRRW